MTFSEALRSQRDNARNMVIGITEAFHTHGATWELDDQLSAVVSAKNALSIYARITSRENKLPGDVDSRAVFPQLRDDPTAYRIALRHGRKAMAQAAEDTEGDVIKGLPPAANILGRMFTVIYDCELALTDVRLGEGKGESAPKEETRLDKVIQNVKTNGDKVPAQV